ncbi:MAG: ABC transporter ATP-binding protein [Gammaproteobacteria bacterium]|nr:ABC transporter ATP-binding protein [Gammaproteobacteria bacterium]MCY4218020.1 ABC transporter ATP-binding protein [Gammaproteobacteria bacterium]MCY4274407.1 ABC transporter ATP-binding protein [Gammaproteobacteria bacterium]
MSENRLRLEGVCRDYGTVKAVDNVDLIVEQGEFLVLLGPSGSGKTTLLSMMGGFTEPSSGKIYIGQEDITDMPPASRPTVTVFQDYALFPHMSVYDNVAFGLTMHKVSKNERTRRVEESLEKVGLKGFEGRGIHQLSGGQRQRVALARAIAVEPAVLLLDEPLGALDLKIRHQMQEELVHLQKSLNTTFVHVTHDQDEAMSMADNIALINHGKIMDYGPPERIYLRPANRFTANFMGDSNMIEATITSQQDGSASVASPFGVFEIPCQFQSGTEVSIIWRPEQIRVGSDYPSEGVVHLGEAKVLEVVFQGTHRQCHVRCGAKMDHDLLVKVSPRNPVVSGDMLEIYAFESDAVILTD